jgi:hypothetical protein
MRLSDLIEAIVDPETGELLKAEHPRPMNETQLNDEARPERERVIAATAARLIPGTIKPVDCDCDLCHPRPLMDLQTRLELQRQALVEALYWLGQGAPGRAREAMERVL